MHFGRFSKKHQSPVFRAGLDLWQKCYTAEEIGDAVGLSGGKLFDEVSSVSEDVLKRREVQFSEPDWSPPIYNVEAYQVRRESLLLGMQINRYFQKTKKKAGHQRARRKVLII